MTLRTKGVVQKVNRKSTSPAFKDLEKYDVLLFEVLIDAVGRNRSTYATYIKITNTRTGLQSFASFNQIVKLLDCCELEELEV